MEKLSGSALASVNVVYSMENIVQFAKGKDWLSCILCICVESCCRIVCRKQSDVHMIINCFSKMIYCVSEQLQTRLHTVHSRKINARAKLMAELKFMAVAET